MEKKNKIVITFLMICNLSLFLIRDYFFPVFAILSLLILAAGKSELVPLKKVRLPMAVFIVVFLALNLFSFWLNPPVRAAYYVVVSGIKILLYAGLLWFYLSGLSKKTDSNSKPVSAGIKRREVRFSSKVHLSIIFGLLLISHLFYFFAFCPGNMYIDSYSQWGQAMGGIPLDNWHPVFSTLLLRISYYLSGTPVVFTLLQVFGSVAVFTYLAGILIRKKVRPVLVYLFIFFILAGTVTLTSMVTLYKDNLYNIALLFMTLFLVEIMDSNGEWLKHRFLNVILFIVNAVFIMLCRHNGFYVLLGSFAVLIVFTKGLRIYFSAILSVLVVVYAIFTGPVFEHYEVMPGSASEKYNILLQHIGAVIANDGAIEEADAAFLEQILPLDVWKEKYTEAMIDPVKFHESYRKEVIDQNESELLKVWWNVVKDNPGLIVKAHMEQIRPIWDLNGWEHGLAGAVLFHFFIDSPKEYYDPYEQEYTFPLNALRNEIEQYKFETNSYDLETKPFTTTLSAIGLLCLLMSGMIMIKEKKWKWLLVFIPVFMNIGTLILAMPAYNMRYVLSTIYIGLFSLFLPYVIKEKKQTEMD